MRSYPGRVRPCSPLPKPLIDAYRTRGFGRGDGVVVEAVLRQPAGSEVLDDDVGAMGQLAGEGRVGLVGEVEDHGPLVAVDAEEVGRDAVVDRRDPRTGVVAARALDLDHLGAEVGEQHRRVGPGEDAREVRDEKPVERAGRGVAHVRVSLRAVGMRTIVRYRCPDSQAPPTNVKRSLDMSVRSADDRPQTSRPGVTDSRRSRGPAHPVRRRVPARHRPDHGRHPPGVDRRRRPRRGRPDRRGRQPVSRLPTARWRSTRPAASSCPA